AFDQLHRDEDVRAGFAAAYQPHDAGVVELRHRRGFTAESPHVVGDRRHLGSEDLHRDRRAVGDAGAAKDLAPSALPDPLVDGEARERRERALRLLRRRWRRRLRVLALDLEPDVAVAAPGERTGDEEAHVAADVAVRAALNGSLLQGRLRLRYGRLSHPRTLTHP